MGMNFDASVERSIQEIVDYFRLPVSIRKANWNLNEYFTIERIEKNEARGTFYRNGRIKKKLFGSYHYGMLLQRWSNYVANSHGGNKELKRIVDSEGIEYVRSYFRYSILENYNAKIDDAVILERESWWKNIPQMRTFGYNDN